MLHAVIMAGGSGTRFWPESRADRPKQLLTLLGERSMIQSTMDRLAAVVGPDRVLVATNARLAAAIGEQLPELAAGAMLLEPCKRDTAPCLGLAAVHLLKRDEEATMVVLPADHVIQSVDAFTQAVRQAETLVDENPQRLVTFGIRPTYPAQSFGYVERGQPLAAQQTTNSTSPSPSFHVKKFREKPDAQTAQAYLDSGDFYWNSGIFVWRAARIMELLGRHQPAMVDHLRRIAAAIGGDDYEAVLAEQFTAIEPISIDYAVMEQADEVVVIEAPFDWDDVGSWQALSRLRPPDDDGNTLAAKHLGVDTSGCIIRGDDNHLIVTLGMKDTIIVHTPDATLVANKHDEEAIRQLVKRLEELGWTEYL
ncbi:MAG: mannose-1-phosphate guanylyltransferase [Planctomycetes bacterium]|nr:mannose-1-phosphate guanylyltransferase [Planctomycetota bacterium]